MVPENIPDTTIGRSAASRSAAKEKAKPRTRRPLPTCAGYYLELLMDAMFYIAAVVAILATVMVITRLNAVHALLYLIVSLLAVAVIFFTLGAPFIAALEVIIYAGAIMVVFVFVAMLLNLGDQAAAQERQWFSPGIWIAPGILTAVLMVELVYMLITGAGRMFGTTGV